MKDIGIVFLFLGVFGITVLLGLWPGPVTYSGKEVFRANN